MHAFGPSKYHVIRGVAEANDLNTANNHCDGHEYRRGFNRVQHRWGMMGSISWVNFVFQIDPRIFSAEFLRYLVLPGPQKAPATAKNGKLWHKVICSAKRQASPITPFPRVSTHLNMESRPEALLFSWPSYSCLFHMRWLQRHMYGRDVGVAGPGYAANRANAPPAHPLGAAGGKQRPNLPGPRLHIPINCHPWHVETRARKVWPRLFLLLRF